MIDTTVVVTASNRNTRLNGTTSSYNYHHPFPFLFCSKAQFLMSMAVSHTGLTAQQCVEGDPCMWM